MENYYALLIALMDVKATTANERKVQGIAVRLLGNHHIITNEELADTKLLENNLHYAEYAQENGLDPFVVRSAVRMISHVAKRLYASAMSSRPMIV